MLKGYGKIVRVDLTAEKISYKDIDEGTARKYIGGVGLAAKILWDETTGHTEPLSPENLLMFMTGPLTGTLVPSSSRYVAAGLSPLTDIWGKGSAGGSWGYELRHAGFAGIVVKGKSERPVYLWLHDGKAEIRDAGHLWGKDTYETTELLRSETHGDAGTACIGPAGEKLVKIACIMTDGKRGRAAARSGLGALMGSKKLKAVVAKGTLPIHYHNEERFRQSVRKIHEIYPPRKRNAITPVALTIMTGMFPSGNYPVKNWSEGTFAEGIRLAVDVQRATPEYCKGCPYGCGESHYTADGERHTVAEAWAPIGTNCLIDNPEALQQAYSLCNRYGLDSISTGGVIAFAMECFEKGLITKNDTGGIELTWGNREAMLEMVRKIGEREGLGELLGEGVRKAAERIGGIATEYAIHVKGLEFPLHDPRARTSMALAYATGSIGATHMENPGANYPELGYRVPLSNSATEGYGVLCAKTQDFGSMLDSLVVCLLGLAGEGKSVQPSRFAELLNSAFGWDMDLDEFMLIGERICNLKRMLNVRRGISRKDDTLPPRILTHKRGGTNAASENLPFLGLMLNEYYKYRGWSEEGIPTKEKLYELGLEECLNER